MFSIALLCQLISSFYVNKQAVHLVASKSDFFIMHGASRSSTSLPPRLIPPIARVRPLPRSPRFVPVAALAPARRPSEDSEDSSSSDVSFYSIGSADETSPASSAPSSPPRHASANVSEEDASAFDSAAAFAPRPDSPPADRFASARPHPDAVRVRIVRPRCDRQVIV